MSSISSGFADFTNAFRAAILTNGSGVLFASARRMMTSPPDLPCWNEQ
jgi:hypothetical protein